MVIRKYKIANTHDLLRENTSQLHASLCTSSQCHSSNQAMPSPSLKSFSDSKHFFESNFQCTYVNTGAYRKRNTLHETFQQITPQKISTEQKKDNEWKMPQLLKPVNRFPIRLTAPCYMAMAIQQKEILASADWGPFSFAPSKGLARRFFSATFHTPLP